MSAELCQYLSLFTTWEAPFGFLWSIKLCSTTVESMPSKGTKELP